MKRPSFQFYPSDWRKDTALQFCSLAAQGLWINLICIAHECEPYGHLIINGKPMDNQSIGRIVGLSAKECKKLLDELFNAGVCSINDEGVIFSRRMLRDEDIRNKRAQGGKEGAEHGIKGASHGVKGGRPTTNKGGLNNPPYNSNEDPPIKPPPSSSSSSSISVISDVDEVRTVVPIRTKPINQPQIQNKPPNHHDLTKFQMQLDWKPSEQFETLARISGLMFPDKFPVTELGEFKTYWLTHDHQPLDQSQWEHKFIQNLLHLKARNSR